MGSDVPAGAVSVEQGPGDCHGQASGVPQVDDEHTGPSGECQLREKLPEAGCRSCVHVVCDGHDGATPAGLVHSRTQASPAAGRERCRGPVGQRRTQLGEGPGEHPRDRHLRGVQLVGDLRLRPAAVEIPADDVPGSGRQSLDGGPQCHPVAHRFQCLVSRAEQILLLAAVFVGPGRPVQGVRPVRRHAPLGRAHVHRVDPECRGELALRGPPVQTLRQVVADAGDLQAALLQPPRHVHTPHPVPEVALQLAEDRGGGVAGEAGTPVRIVCVHGLDECERCDLLQVVQGLAPVLVAPGQPSGQRQVPAHHGLPQAVTLAATTPWITQLANRRDGRVLPAFGRDTGVVGAQDSIVRRHVAPVVVEWAGRRLPTRTRVVLDGQRQHR